MKSLSIKIAILFCLAANSLVAQVPMETWQSYMTYNNTTMIEETPERIFAVSGGSLFSIGKEDHDIQTYTKANGLNGANVVQIKYDESTKQLIIIYSDGNIDLMSGSGIVNVPDFYLKQMSAEKIVNHVMCYNGNAYLSTNFGILVLNLKKAEISDTYYMGANSSNVKVLGADIFNGKIYACSADYIYSADLNSNLVDFGHWTASADYAGTGAFQSLACSGDYLFILRGVDVYRKSNATGSDWQLLEEGISKMKRVGSKIYVFWTADVGIFQQNMDFAIKHSPSGVKINDFIEIGGLSLYAFEKEGVAFEKGNEVSYFKPEGPLFTSAYCLQFSNNKLYVVHSGTNFNSINYDAGISILDNRGWKFILPQDISAISQKPLANLLNIAFDPNDFSHFFVTSHGTGLYEFRNDEFIKHYTHSNSPLEYNAAVSESAGDYYTQLNGIAFDKQSNLTVINCGVNASVKILFNNGSWKSVQYPNALTYPSGAIGVNS
ncbi:MAG: hypothetical protein LBB41_03835, partial [Prevotellaceae bacterium]|nr:hypothetical protein [Prevotellaceae bacterium]